MGLIPRGPGPHDTAASLKIPQNVSEALQIAAAGQCLPLDLGILNRKKVTSKYLMQAVPAELLQQPFE